MYTELMQIIESLQSGELGIDEAVAQYEKSKELIKKLEKHLESAENKITKIKASMK
jgi:exodeoxyribonuclease VII small subunit